MRTWFKHLLLAGWAVLAAWLACEWLLPGSVSAFFPVFGSLSVWTVLTLLVGPHLSPFRRLWVAGFGFLLPCLAVFGLSVVFSVRAGSSLVFVVVGLVCVLLLSAIFSFFVPVSEPVSS